MRNLYFVEGADSSGYVIAESIPEACEHWKQHEAELSDSEDSTVEEPVAVTWLDLEDNILVAPRSKG